MLQLQSLSDNILYCSCDEELAYLVSMQFLPKQTVDDIALCRQVAAEAEQVIKSDLEALNHQRLENVTDNADVDWDVDWDASDEPSDIVNDENAAWNQLLEDKMAANEKVKNHFKTSVSESVRQSMGAIHELVAQFDVAKQFPSNISMSQCFDILTEIDSLRRQGDQKSKSSNSMDEVIHLYCFDCIVDHLILIHSRWVCLRSSCRLILLSETVTVLE